MNALRRYKYTSYIKNGEKFENHDIYGVKIRDFPEFLKFLKFAFSMYGAKSTWWSLKLHQSVQKRTINKAWRHTCSCHDADDVIVVTWLRRGRLSVGMTLLVKRRHLYVTISFVLQRHHLYICSVKNSRRRQNFRPSGRCPSVITLFRVTRYWGISMKLATKLIFIMRVGVAEKV